MDKRLQAFIAKPRTFKKDGVELTLTPFKGRDLDLLLKAGGEPTAKDVVELVHKALTESGYEVSVEDVEEMGLSHINWIFECVGAMNGAGEKDNS